MNRKSLWRYSILAAVFACMLTSFAAAQSIGPKIATVCSHTITQNFPTTGPPVTTWTICWSDNPRLAVGPVYFKKSPASPQVMVLWDLRLSEIFVPYHPGQPRFLDLSTFNFGDATLTAADCPASAGGTLLDSTVCQEVHDRGLMWKDPNSNAARRGEELVLWAAIAAANYLYIDEYTFRDDGVIMARMGATGQNLPGDEHIAHSHSPFWRIDIDLDGPTNSAAQIQHIEDIHNSQGSASDPRFPIATEEGFTWDARTHDMMEISNAAFKNAQGNLSTYHLVPIVTGGGLTQDYETFSQNDFWITPYDPTQTQAKNLTQYVAQGRGVANTDIVAWFKGSMHHHPRDEDGVFNSNNVWTGVTHVMKAGFMLMPNDLFDCTPFYHTTCP